MRNNFIFFILFTLLLFSCLQKPKNNSDSENLSSFKFNLKSTPLKYAKRFAIASSKNATIVYLFGNKSLTDTTATYIIIKDSSLNYQLKKNEFIVKQPVNNIASLSSLYCNMIENINCVDKITALENIDYYNSEKILNRFNANKITELSKGPKLNIEQTLSLKPDLLFNFGMPGDVATEYEKLNDAGIVTAICLDHLEKEPLARSEWIKFFAAFLNKESLADSLFNGIEKNYYYYKKIATKSKTQPSVFTELKYGDVWYEPGGKSFMAQLIKDANANYLWQSDTNTGSLNLSFEAVINTAKNADYWLNLSSIKTKDELLKTNSRYGIFKALKNGNCFNNTLYCNSKGYSTYWESGILFPDKLLSDLIQIFHPHLKDSIQNPFYYYKQLQ